MQYSKFKVMSHIYNLLQPPEHYQKLKLFGHLPEIGPPHTFQHTPSQTSSAGCSYSYIDSRLGLKRLCHEIFNPYLRKTSTWAHTFKTVYNSVANLFVDDYAILNISPYYFSLFIGAQIEPF